MENTAGIDLELNADTRHSSGRRFKVDGKATEAPVVLRALAFTLEDVDEHVRLVVDRRRENFAGLDRNSRIAGNNYVHQSSECFDAERERRHVQQQQISETTRE